MKKFLLATCLLAQSSLAQSVNSPCYWSGQLVKCFPTTGIFLNNSRTLRLGTNNATNYVELAAPSGMGNNYSVVLPATAGQVGNLLYNVDGSGTLGWTAPGATQSSIDGTIANTQARRVVDLVCHSNTTISGSQTCDGQSTSGAVYVLLMGQTTPSDNGIYQVDEFSDWTRLSTQGLVAGSLVNVTSQGAGTDYSDSLWLGYGDGGTISNYHQVPTIASNVNLTASSAVVTDSSGHLVSSSTTVAAGVYTPTVTNSTNTDSAVTTSQAQYSRVGSVVTVSGRFTADPTLAATTTSFEITLPVASNIGAAEDASGVAFCGSIAAMGGEIKGVSANDTAIIFWKSSDINSQTWSYTFTYRVI